MIRHLRWRLIVTLSLIAVVSAVTSPLPVHAQGSAIVMCKKKGFHAFYQNMKSKSVAAARARQDCIQIGVQKFQLTRTAATACCTVTRSISTGCLAMAEGNTAAKREYYFASGTWRIETVLAALKKCERDYFDCQVKATTCVGNK